jgi:hypothetical protein
MGPVRRAHLHHPGTSGRKDLRYAERPPDLHQLAPGHDHLATAGERRRGEHQGCGVVVHHQGVGGTRQHAEPARDPRRAHTARAAFEVELEIAIARGCACDRSGRLGGQGRAAEIRVEHDARRVHDARGTRRGQGAARPRRPLHHRLEPGERLAFGAGRHRLPKLLEDAARGIGRGPARNRGVARFDGTEHPIDGWDAASRVGLDLRAGIHDFLTQRDFRVCLGNAPWGKAGSSWAGSGAARARRWVSETHRIETSCASQRFQ